MLHIAVDITLYTVRQACSLLTNHLVASATRSAARRRQGWNHGLRSTWPQNYDDHLTDSTDKLSRYMTSRQQNFFSKPTTTSPLRLRNPLPDLPCLPLPGHFVHTRFFLAQTSRLQRRWWARAGRHRVSVSG